MGILKQRQLFILYLIAWAWQHTKKKIARECSLKKGDCVVFRKGKGERRPAVVKKVVGKAIYDIEFSESGAVRRRVRQCPRKRILAPEPVRLPTKWVDAAIVLGGLARGGRGEVRGHRSCMKMYCAWCGSIRFGRRWLSHVLRCVDRPAQVRYRIFAMSQALSSMARKKDRKNGVHIEFKSWTS